MTIVKPTWTIGPWTAGPMSYDTDGTLWLCDTDDGWFGPVGARNYDEDQPSYDGTISSPNRRTSRVVTISGYCKSPDEGTAQAAWDRFNALLSAGPLQQLLVSENTRDLTAMVKLGQGSALTPVGPKKAVWQLVMIAPDPCKYGPAQPYITGLPSAVGSGLDYSSNGLDYWAGGTASSNLVPNPNFATSTTGWSALNASTLTQVTDPIMGTAGRATSTTAASVTGIITTAGASALPVTPDQYYVISAAFNSSVTQTIGFFVDWSNAGGGYISTSALGSGSVVAGAATVLASAQPVLAPVGAASARVYADATMAVGVWLDMTNVVFGPAAGMGLDYGTPGSNGLVSANNPGSAEAWPLFTVTGGAMPLGFSITDDAGHTLAYSGALSASDKVTLQSNPITGRTVVLNGSTYVRANLSPAQWAPIPAGGSMSYQFGGSSTDSPKLSVSVAPRYW